MADMGIHHIGIGVPDLAKSMEFYCAVLGVESVELVEWPELGLRAAVIRVGKAVIELIEPVSPRGAIAEDLASQVSKRGSNVHHLAVEVDDLDEALSRLTAAGIELVDEAPRSVAGGRIAWLRSNPAPGALIELVESGYRIC
jgi:methylmalonyl-CoA/ethylmalonyl-CoA epimerase